MATSFASEILSGLTCNPDDERELVAVEVPRDLPTSEGGEVDAGHDELIALCPTPVAFSIALERSCWTINPSSGHGESAWFSVRIVALSPEEQLLSVGRVGRRVMGQSTPCSCQRKRRPKSVGAEPKLADRRSDRMRRRRNKRPVGRFRDRARAGHAGYWAVLPKTDRAQRQQAKHGEKAGEPDRASHGTNSTSLKTMGRQRRNCCKAR